MWGMVQVAGRRPASPFGVSASGNPGPQLPVRPFPGVEVPIVFSYIVGGACLPRAFGVSHTNWDCMLWGLLPELSETMGAAGSLSELGERQRRASAG